jgi:hypothetical protein
MSAKDFLTELQDRGFSQAYQNERATHSTYEIHLSTDKSHPTLFWTNKGKSGIQGEYPKLWQQQSHREMYDLTCEIINDDVKRPPSKKHKRGQKETCAPAGESFKIIVENKGVSPTKRSATSTVVEDEGWSPLKRSSSSTSKKVRQKETEFMLNVQTNISVDTARAIMTVMHAKQQLQTQLYSKELASGSKVKKADIILRHDTVMNAAIDV